MISALQLLASCWWSAPCTLPSPPPPPAPPLPLPPPAPPAVCPLLRLFISLFRPLLSPLATVDFPSATLFAKHLEETAPALDLEMLGTLSVCVCEIRIYVTVTGWGLTSGPSGPGTLSSRRSSLQFLKCRVRHRTKHGEVQGEARRGARLGENVRGATCSRDQRGSR